MLNRSAIQNQVSLMTMNPALGIKHLGVMSTISEMVRKTDIRTRKCPVLLESDYQTASCCSEDQGVAVWKEQNLSSQKDIPGKSCSVQFLARQRMKQSSSQDCLLASEDFTVSHRAYQQWSGSRKFLTVTGNVKEDYLTTIFSNTGTQTTSVD